ncbi:MAG: MATE family efflux transporter, partial [Candidatus Spyradocola sp.]
MEQKNSFTQGPILRPMLRFALPVLGTLLLQTMYGAVDMLVVGQFAEAADVSAVSTGSWLMQLVTSLVTGVSMGTTVLLGRRIGEERPEEAGRLIGASIVLFALMTAVITVLVECFATPIARIMQVPKEAFTATEQYVRICAGGAVFIVAYNVLGSIFRGLGNSRIPLMTVAIACVVNIVGDLLLVGVLRMAAAGAAIATVAAQGISVALSMGI